MHKCAHANMTYCIKPYKDSDKICIDEALHITIFELIVDIPSSIIRAIFSSSNQPVPWYTTSIFIYTLHSTLEG
jgi:hypothetical protein